MTMRKRFKAPSSRPRIVGVIASLADVRAAARLRNPPDLFEIRFDHLFHDLDKVENQLPILAARAPLIITARHPREGGKNNLSLKNRRELLFRFLPSAHYIDVELRSVRSLRSVLKRARKRKVGCIISFHDFCSTSIVRALQAKYLAAEKCGADIFKIATRTDSKSDLVRLFDFFSNNDSKLAISAMGFGKFGRESRRELMRRGSALNYAGIGRSHVRGQPSLSESRSWAKFPRVRSG